MNSKEDWDTKFNKNLNKTEISRNNRFKAINNDKLWLFISNNEFNKTYLEL